MTTQEALSRREYIATPDGDATALSWRDWPLPDAVACGFVRSTLKGRLLRRLRIYGGRIALWWWR